MSANERIALNVDLLAAGRVYLLRMSPCDAVGSYPTHFTLTPCGGGFVSVALSLGFPPVAVNDCHYPVLPGLSSCLLSKRPSTELSAEYYTPLAVFSLEWASRVLFTIPSANWLNSRATCENVTFSKCLISSRMRSWTGHSSRFLIL